MNLHEVQELRNSIVEIRNDENLQKMMEHLMNAKESSNPQYQTISIQFAMDSLKNFQNLFDEKMQTIDNVFLQLQKLLEN
ncbi:hypothetical protein [uncultured Chryseobacterium sp.]|uniref:hypothetical protein n=1 Tax=uncultured Chryseobacterium sp. TaxID=259322 RepID=UPI0025EB65F7|nr:hypothetical protein [uncultured Chryseobacterium sp.]